MTNAELKLSLIERITRTDDPLMLRTLHEVLTPEPYPVAEDHAPPMVREDAAPLATDAEWAVDTDYLVDDDEVIGVRPDGSQVTAGAAVTGWDADVADVLAGGGFTGDEVLAYLRERRLQRG